MTTETSHRFDVLAIGNALVDVLSHEDDAFIAAHGLHQGAAVMVDAATSDAVYADMSPGTEVSGGSAANTAVGLASFGAPVAYIGRVHDDQLGKVFAHDLRAAGVNFDTPMATDGPPTGRCLVIVTADAERTMCTYLGAADRLTVADVNDEAVASAAVVYLEGYLWDQPEAKDALRHAMRVAGSAARRVALTLSDPFCVDRHRAEFLDLLRDHVDVVFANAAEVCSLFEVDDVTHGIERLRGMCEIAAVTCSAEGSVIVTAEAVHTVEAEPVDELVDLTGAGDLYAAGFLFGLTRGADLPACGRLGSVAATEVIGHLGARPAVSLATLAQP